MLTLPDRASQEYKTPPWCYHGVMESNEVRLTLRLPRELSERVDAAASADRRSKNAELVTLIERGLGQQDQGDDHGR